MNIYLTGPMTGYADNNHPEFNRVAAILEAAGHVVFNPADNFAVERTRRDYMTIDVPAVCAADAVVVMKGWSESGGSNIEILTAWYCEVPVFSYQDKEAALPVDADPKDRFTLVPLESRPSRLPYSLEEEDRRPINIIAEDLINGARRSAYGHPAEDYARVAGMVNAAFAHKLKPGESFSAKDMPIFIMFMKISREINFPKRDNRIDGAGYWGVLDMIHEYESHAVALGNEEFADRMRESLRAMMTITASEAEAMRVEGEINGSAVHRETGADVKAGRPVQNDAG